MSKSARDKLTSDRIRQLIAAVGAKSHEDTSSDIDAVDFDWRQPRYFNLEQCEKLQGFAETVAGECVEEFSRLYQADSSVSLISAKQCFLPEPDREPEEQGYYVPFGMGSQALVGFLFIPTRSALVWTGQILGSADAPEGTDRELSTLEESLLSDIASGLLQAFSRAYAKELTVHSVVSDRSAIDLKGSEELYEITFEAAKESQETAVTRGSFVVCCDKLDSIAGKAASSQAKVSDAQIANSILEHIHQVPVAVSVELGNAMIPFREVLGLQANDIILLDKKVTETIDVLIEDRGLFQGRPIQSGGNYAVVIM